MKKELVILTGVGFSFTKANASTNLTINIAKAYESLGYRTLIIPQNPSFSRNEKRSGRFDDIEYEYPLKKKNLFDGYSGIKRSINYRIGIFVNSVITSLRIFKDRKIISHVFSETLRPSNIFIIGIACRLAGVKFVYHMVEEPWTLQRFSDMAWWRLLWKNIESFTSCLFLYTISLRLPNYIACISEELITLLDKLKLNKEKLLYLPSVKFNNLNVRKTGTSTINITKHSIPRIVYSGQISQSKESFSKVFDALKIVNAQSEKVEFHIYGGGNQDAIESLKSKIISMDVAGFVFYHGFVSREELKAAQESAVLCVLLKRDIPFNRYNFPTKLLDYLAAKKPILLSNLPLHTKLFTNRENALIVDPESAEAIAEALIWSIENPLELNKFGIKSSELLEVNLDAKKNIQELITKIET